MLHIHAEEVSTPAVLKICLAAICMANVHNTADMQKVWRQFFRDVAELLQQRHDPVCSWGDPEDGVIAIADACLRKMRIQGLPRSAIFSRSDETYDALTVERTMWDDDDDDDIVAALSRFTTSWDEIRGVQLARQRVAAKRAVQAGSTERDNVLPM